MNDQTDTARAQSSKYTDAHAHATEEKEASMIHRMVEIAKRASRVEQQRTLAKEAVKRTFQSRLRATNLVRLSERATNTQQTADVRPSRIILGKPFAVEHCRHPAHC